MSELTEQARVIADRLTTIMRRVEIAFTDETAENLVAAIDNIETVSTRIALLVDQQAESFTEMTAELNTAATQVGGAASAVESTFNRLDELVGGEDVDSLVLDMRGVARNLREASQQMTLTAQTLEGTLSRADSTFATVNRIAGQIEAGEGGLGRLLSDTSLVVRAEGALAQLNFLLQDLQENPNRYFRLSIF
jgi:phospholipid/cholesterol/gamma-HCH transport system substrate-binding protein